MNSRAALLTLLALVAFASNSILCRLALADGGIDAAGFTLVRIASGAVCLAALCFIKDKRLPWGEGSWASGALLFGYAGPFSLAYLNIAAGTGGLILFGSVQFTMLGAGIIKGERPGLREWTGLAIALAGLVVLVLPGLHAPAPVAAALMALSGICWGIYSLRGRSAKNPTQATADNFIRALPFAVLMAVIGFAHLEASPQGAALAVISGAVTSGLGYALWYAVQPSLTATKAGIIQLAVPALVAVGGILFLHEALTLRLVAATVMMLGGVGLAVRKER